jgi:hypothetical protein
MKKIKTIRIASNYQLFVKFDNGVEKQFDMNPYFQFPVFSVLRDEKIFEKVVNKNYFIEWQNVEVDLSADTLWHEGKIIN